MTFNQLSPIKMKNPIPQTAFDRNKDLRDFIDYLTLKELSESTIREYLIRYKLFPIDNITSETVNAFLIEHRGNLPRAFVRNYLEFRNIYNIKIPMRTGRKKIRLPPKLTEEEIRRLRLALYKRNIKYGILFEISKDSGLRRTEVINLTPQMFNWDDWGKDQTKPCRARIIGKGNKERQIIISPDTARRLKNYLKPFIKAGVIRMNSKIFNITAKHWWKILVQESERVLERRIKPHSLRHDTATKWYSTGDMDLMDIKNLLGHSNISTTQLYLHPDEEKTLKKLEQLYDKSK